jgi:hypothetical protein
VFANFAVAVVRLNLDQVAGAGDAVFGAEMGDGDGFFDHQVWILDVLSGNQL